jgi:hypothetical protein
MFRPEQIGSGWTDRIWQKTSSVSQRRGDSVNATPNNSGGGANHRREGRSVAPLVEVDVL